MPDLSFFSLEGKTALVAGASRGIGLAIAQHLARAGARTLMAARSVDKLQIHAEELKKQGFAAEALSLDVTRSESIAEVGERAGDVDIFIAVAGTNLRKRFETYTVEEYERMMNTNLHGFVFLTQKIGARMVQRARGAKSSLSVA
jgi:NADP-dependent 3-hydroxy acid dehydrogenase YdfG